MNAATASASPDRKDAKKPADVRQPKPAPQPDDFSDLTDRQRQAMTVRDAVIPALMQTAIAPAGSIDGTTARGYRDQLLQDMGDPTDALERMLIEQAALAHVMTMQLHASTAMAKTPEGAGVYAAAAARLMAELRRTILAVREYRTPLTRPVVTKIEQQNVAHTQAVSYVGGTDDGASMACREKIEADGKQGSIPAETNDGNPDDDEIPGPRGRWSAQPAVAGTAHGRRTAAASRSGAGD